MCVSIYVLFFFFFFQAEDGIRDGHVTGVQTCALPIWITVAVGLGVPRPFLSGVVVVGRPPRPFAYYPAPAVIVVLASRPYFRPFVVVRRVYAGRYHRRYHWDDDDE